MRPLLSKECRLSGRLLKAVAFIAVCSLSCGCGQSVSPEQAKRELEKLGVPCKDQEFIMRVRNEDAEVASLLLDAGIDPNTMGDWSFPALLQAASHNENPGTTKLLLKKGADVNVTDKDGQTALMIAARHKAVAIVGALISHGADIEMKSASGWTALMWACSVGDLPTVHALVKARAKLETRDDAGRTAVFIAASEGHLDIVSALIDKGADINVPVEGKTMLQYAREAGKTVLVSLLESAGAEIQEAAADGLAMSDDPRAATFLYQAFSDPDPAVRGHVLAGMARHRDQRALAPLLAGVEAAEDPLHPASSLYALRSYPGNLIYVPLLEILGRAAQARHHWIRQAILNAPEPETPAYYEALRPFLAHPAPQVSVLAAELVARPEQQRRHAARERRRALVKALRAPLQLLVMGLLSALLGLFLFAWAFRLLRLRAIMRDLPVSATGSVAMGLTAVKGRATAATTSSVLTHPYTGDTCVFYAGAARRGNDHTFAVNDGSGELKVHTAGAVLLSEDGLVSAGETVHIVGITQRAVAADGSTVYLGRARTWQSSFHRIVGFLLNALFHTSDGQATTTMLFGNPSDFFWIWDDAREKPLSSKRELLTIIGVFVFAGVWILTFFALVIYAIGQQLDAL